MLMQAMSEQWSAAYVAQMWADGPPKAVKACLSQKEFWLVLPGICGLWGEIFIQFHQWQNSISKSRQTLMGSICAFVICGRLCVQINQEKHEKWALAIVLLMLSSDESRWCRQVCKNLLHIKSIIIIAWVQTKKGHIASRLKQHLKREQSVTSAN